MKSRLHLGQMGRAWFEHWTSLVFSSSWRGNWRNVSVIVVLDVDEDATRLINENQMFQERRLVKT